MVIKSTIHVHKKIMEMLNKSAESTGRTRAFIIKLLMQRVMNDNQKLLKSYSRVKYQKRDLKENWHTLHITMNENENMLMKFRNNCSHNATPTPA